MRPRPVAILVTIPWLWIAAPSAILLSSGAAAVTMDWVLVGNPGNAPDPNNSTCGPSLSTPCGAVAYPYEIGKYEVTNSQYAEFLNAVDPAGANTLSLYYPAFDDSQNPHCVYFMVDCNYQGIRFVPAQPSGGKYVVKVGMGHKPVNLVSWFSALRFANWMHNGQGPGSTETGAYTLLGGTPTPSNALTVARNPGAIVFLPSEHEWYKAAYYSGASVIWLDYPTGTNSVPVCGGPSAVPNRANCSNPGPTDVGAYGGSPSAYGTFDQGGNLFEWEESLWGTVAAAAGGDFNSGTNYLMADQDRAPFPAESVYNGLGFRVARTPEPTQCSDGIDNDGDGLIDYPADPGCSSLADTSEASQTGVVDVGSFYLKITDASPPLMGSFSGDAVFSGALSVVGNQAVSGSYSVVSGGPPVQGIWTSTVLSADLEYFGSGNFTCPLTGCNSGEDSSFVGQLPALVDLTGLVPANASYTLDGANHLIPSLDLSSGSCVTGGLVRCMLGKFALNAFPHATTPQGTQSSVGFDSSYYNALAGTVVPFQASATFGNVSAAGTTTVSALSDGAPVPANFATEADGFHATYYDVSTTATYAQGSGTNQGVVFCTSYPPLPPGTDECDMRLLHGQPGPDGVTFPDDATIKLPDALCPLTGASLCAGKCIDVILKQICARVDHLSPFVTALDLRPQCSNGYDDDGDGLIDYPNDPQCVSAFDLSEQNQSSSIYVNTTVDELTPNGNCSLREAIRAANLDQPVDGCAAGADFDNIHIPAGTYHLTLAGPDEDDAVSGDLDVRSPLALIGAGAGVTVIDATGLGDRVLHVKPSGVDLNVEIRGLTLRGGSASSGSGGGGLFIEGSSGPPLANPTTLVEDCVIEWNTATGAGGGVALDHPTGGTTTLSRDVIRSNLAFGAGGLDANGAGVNVVDSTVEDNQSIGSGLLSAGGIADRKRLTLRGSSITANVASDGPGGIGASNDVLSIGNSTVSGNTTNGSGGGIAVGDAAAGAVADVLFSTVVGNQAARGGGIDVGSATAPGDATLSANIVASNTAAIDPDAHGSLTSHGDNVIGIGGASGAFIASDLVGSYGSPIDPKLAPLAANDGLTLTHALLAGSPALDHASCIGVIRDQRKATRPYGSGCDAGAFEYAPACADGLDNDGDGLVDYPADPGCASATGAIENPQCNDGIDNDGDGLIDLADPGCGHFAANNRENPPTCGLLGVEALLPLALLGWLRAPQLRPHGSGRKATSRT